MSDDRRVFNFSAGPACLPLPVLDKVARELTSWEHTGMSVMEMSHRSKNFQRIKDRTTALLRELLNLSEMHELLYTSSGATFNFAAVPLSCLGPQLPATKCYADYVVGGSWSEKAATEAKRYGPVREHSFKGKDGKYHNIPGDELIFNDCSGKYLYYCSNETVMGLEFKSAPKANVPLVCDMSSNFLSKPVDLENHGFVFAGGQKNVAPASLCIGIVSKQFKDTADINPMCPTLMNIPLMTTFDSLYNTPNCWSIYLAGEVCAWIKQQGGLTVMDENARKRSGMVYDLMDSSNGYYASHVAPTSRSRMNIPFRVGFGDVVKEKQFMERAEKIGLVELKGHRSIGGCRASLYNAMPMEGVERLVDFMKTFMEEDSTKGDSSVNVNVKKTPEATVHTKENIP